MDIDMKNDVGSVLLSEAQINGIVEKLAKRITEDYKNSPNLILLGILKGSVIFFSDLMRKIDIPCQMEFMRVSSYSGTKTTGNINILLDLNRVDIGNCDVLIIEDIIDSGRTLTYLKKYIAGKGARSVRTCTLLDKPSRREVTFVPDYVGAEIPDEFVVGYGLDYNDYYRNLPYIGVLKREIYEK